MIEPTSPGVREISASLLHLRSDLVFAPSLIGENPFVMVEDPLSSRFYRLGKLEYAFASLLDGKTTLREVYAKFSKNHPEHHLTENDAIALCRWLVEMELASTASKSDTNRQSKLAESLQQKEVWKNLNPLSFRLPIWQPDATMEVLSKRLGWMFSVGVFPLWCLLIAIGTISVASDWDRFSASSQGIFGYENWLWLALSWAGLKVAHELAHGVACKRHGGNVREAGLVFMFFAPLAYVDVTSTWRFRSRWQRIQVALAGMYCELAIAAICGVIWSRTGNAWIEHFCYNTIVMASIATIVINANPLMKFDGYYILSDTLDLPNLYSNGQSYLQYWARRYLMGLPVRMPFVAGRMSFWIRIYAWFSLAWRMTVCFGLIVASVTMFHGAGIVIAVVAVTAWLVVPTIRVLKSVFFGIEFETKNRLRFFGSIAATATAFWFLFFWMPWPGAQTAPAVVEYREPAMLRARSPGFVKEVCVENGQIVFEGQTLVLLENEQLVNEKLALEFQIKQSEIKERVLEQNQKQAERQAEMERRLGLQKQYAEKSIQVEHLTIVAPQDGRIVMNGLQHQVGTYLDLGDDLLLIGDESSKELQVSLSQDDMHAFQGQAKPMVNAFLPHRKTFRSYLTSIRPRASIEPIHPAMITINGGSLPVAPKKSEDSEASSKYELMTPRFNATVELCESESRSMYAGQIGVVSYRTLDLSIGEYLYRWLSQWIRKRLETQDAPQ